MEPYESAIFVGQKMVGHWQFNVVQFKFLPVTNFMKIKCTNLSVLSTVPGTKWVSYMCWPKMKEWTNDEWMNIYEWSN